MCVCVCININVLSNESESINIISNVMCNDNIINININGQW